jgi:hypothetical protein
MREPADASAAHSSKSSNRRDVRRERNKYGPNRFYTGMRVRISGITVSETPGGCFPGSPVHRCHRGA